MYEKWSKPLHILSNNKTKHQRALNIHYCILHAPSRINSLLTDHNTIFKYRGDYRTIVGEATSSVLDTCIWTRTLIIHVIFWKGISSMVFMLANNQFHRKSVVQAVHTHIFLSHSLSLFFYSLSFSCSLIPVLSMETRTSYFIRMLLDLSAYDLKRSVISYTIRFICRGRRSFVKLK